MTDKITLLQLETLSAIDRGEVEQRNYGHGAWRIVGANPSVVGRLVSMGLAKWTEVVDGKAEITDAGRAAIAKATGATS